MIKCVDVLAFQLEPTSLFVMQHKPMSEITAGLHRGIYHQGKLRVNRYNPFEAYVGSESIGDEILIHGRGNMNRAFDGDIVVVELLPEDQWQEGKSLSIVDDGTVSNHTMLLFNLEKGFKLVGSALVKLELIILGWVCVPSHDSYLDPGQASLYLNIE